MWRGSAHKNTAGEAVTEGGGVEQLQVVRRAKDADSGAAAGGGGDEVEAAVAVGIDEGDANAGRRRGEAGIRVEFAPEAAGRAVEDADLHPRDAVLADDQLRPPIAVEIARGDEQPAAETAKRRDTPHLLEGRAAVDPHRERAAHRGDDD